MLTFGIEKMARDSAACSACTVQRKCAMLQADMCIMCRENGYKRRDCPVKSTLLCCLNLVDEEGYIRCGIVVAQERSISHYMGGNR